MSLTTYDDLISHVLDYLGADASVAGERYARRAIQAAYSDMPASHLWSYYLPRGRINTVAQQTAGKVNFDLTGGVVERVLTVYDDVLAPGTTTWPTWARYGTVRVGTAVWDVAERIDNYNLQLTAALSPTDDFTAQSYSLYQDTYVMPSDFQALGEVIIPSQARRLVNVTNQEYVVYQRTITGPSTPIAYSIGGDPNYFGALAMRLFPPPDNVYNLDFIYKRFPRPLKVARVTAGLASGTTSSTTVTFTGTTLTPDTAVCLSPYTGSVLRLAATNDDHPTDLSGASPALFERVITNVVDATTVLIDQALTCDLTNVKYTISDPVDIEMGSMYVFFLRECEHQSRIVRRMKSTPEEMLEYKESMWAAYEADNRSFEKVSAGGSKGVFIPYKYMPFNPG